MRTESKERRTDRFTVADDAGDGYTVQEITEFTQTFADGQAPSAPVPGRVRYECAGIPLIALDSGEFEMQTDPPKRCHRIS